MYRVVVTGASGYVGRQTVLALLDAGHEVLGIDTEQIQPGRVAATTDRLQHVLADFSSDIALTAIIGFQPQAVIHCAAASTVGPSMTDPAQYYENNVVRTMRLLDIVRRSLPNARFIFSSSAAVYGEPYINPCHEVDLCEPVNPYGETKLVIERLLRYYNQAYGLDYVAFRYFNVAGADSQGRHGPHRDGSHIIERALQAVAKHSEFALYGTDYPTSDGTCVRDYVHVEDVAQAHVQALDPSIGCGVYNLGTESGHSNREILDAVQRVTGQKLAVSEQPRRPGDPAMLTASPALWMSINPNWRFQSLDSMITSAWEWYQQ